MSSTGTCTQNNVNEGETGTQREGEESALLYFFSWSIVFFFSSSSISLTVVVSRFNPSLSPPISRSSTAQKQNPPGRHMEELCAKWPAADEETIQDILANCAGELALAEQSLTDVFGPPVAAAPPWRRVSRRWPSA